MDDFIGQIKSVLIQLYAKRGDAVLDLACGKVDIRFYLYLIIFLPACADTLTFQMYFFVTFQMYFFLCQGGDLIKWDKAKIGYYVGIDIADGSVKSKVPLTLIFPLLYIFG